MFNLDTIAKFITKSGMRKIGTAVYMFSGSCYLLKIGVLPPESFENLATMLILAVFAGNTLEHYIKTQTPVTAQTPPAA